MHWERDCRGEGVQGQAVDRGEILSCSRLSRYMKRGVSGYVGEIYGGGGGTHEWGWNECMGGAQVGEAYGEDCVGGGMHDSMQTEGQAE